MPNSRTNHHSILDVIAQRRPPLRAFLEALDTLFVAVTVSTLGWIQDSGGFKLAHCQPCGIAVSQVGAGSVETVAIGNESCSGGTVA
jgi:hypothetical protein